MIASDGTQLRTHSSIDALRLLINDDDYYKSCMNAIKKWQRLIRSQRVWHITEMHDKRLKLLTCHKENV